MSFDESFDLIAGVYFYFSLYVMLDIETKPISVRQRQNNLDATTITITIAIKITLLELKTAVKRPCTYVCGRIINRRSRKYVITNH